MMMKKMVTKPYQTLKESHEAKIISKLAAGKIRIIYLKAAYRK